MLSTHFVERKGSSSWPQMAMMPVKRFIHPGSDPRIRRVPMRRYRPSCRDVLHHGMAAQRGET